jgi:hypothetical protein
MRRLFVVAAAALFLCGCDTFRFSPGQGQKENAYLHWRVTEEAARLAGQEQVSGELAGLTALSSSQSRAFVADYGLPMELPADESVERLLDGRAKEIAQSAWESGSRRPDVWQMSEGLFEFGLGLAGILGGAYGIKASQFLRKAQEKSKALKEIVEGNELFKQLGADSAGLFKQAQANQSASTRTLVAELKK